jgi:hypothetical protein
MLALSFLSKGCCCTRKTRSLYVFSAKPFCLVAIARFTSLYEILWRSCLQLVIDDLMRSILQKFVCSFCGSDTKTTGPVCDLPLITILIDAFFAHNLLKSLDSLVFNFLWNNVCLLCNCDSVLGCQRCLSGRLWFELYRKAWNFEF